MSDTPDFEAMTEAELTTFIQGIEDRKHANEAELETHRQDVKAAFEQERPAYEAAIAELKARRAGDPRLTQRIGS